MPAHCFIVVVPLYGSIHLSCPTICMCVLFVIFFVHLDEYIFQYFSRNQRIFGYIYSLFLLRLFPLPHFIGWIPLWVFTVHLYSQCFSIDRVYRFGSVFERALIHAFFFSLLLWLPPLDRCPSLSLFVCVVLHIRANVRPLTRPTNQSNLLIFVHLLQHT